MADEIVDPRENPQHPRFQQAVIGHDAAMETFTKALNRGTPHHAWMISGPRGIGKSTLAFALARKLFNLVTPPEKTRHMIEARSHPDLHILERGLTKSKPVKLRGEISVDDTRNLIQFFARTASLGGWRVGIVDAVDDLNTESANALLKLVEEPPPQSILFLLVHQQGRALRTLRSRCTKLPLTKLSEAETLRVIKMQDLEDSAADIAKSAKLANGSPGRALELLRSTAAKVFWDFQETMEKHKGGPEQRQVLLDRFGPRGPTADEFELFSELLVEWTAAQAASRHGLDLADSYSEITRSLRIAEGYNLDRRAALAQSLKRVEDALKLA
jgi:DNA polymerase III subunit delta'